MRIVRHASEVPSPEDRERLAKLAAGEDQVQEAINIAALKAVGGKWLSVRRRRDHEPSHWPTWLVHEASNEENITTFMGSPYGGETFELAIEDADRIAGKWGWGVVVAEVEPA